MTRYMRDKHGSTYVMTDAMQSKEGFVEITEDEVKGLQREQKVAAVAAMKDVTPATPPEKTVTTIQPNNMEMVTGIGFGTPALTPVPDNEDEPVGETYPTELKDGTVEEAPVKKRGNPNWGKRS